MNPSELPGFLQDKLASECLRFYSLSVSGGPPSTGDVILMMSK